MGTTSGSFTSVALDIEEVEDLAPIVFDVPTPPGCLPIPDVLIADDAIIGFPWTASLTLGLTRTQPGFWVEIYSNSLLNPPNGIIIPQFSGGLNWGSPTEGRKLLITGGGGGRSSFIPHSGVIGSTSSTPSRMIPCRKELVGRAWYMQAIVVGPCLPADGGGTVRMSTAVGGVIGTAPNAPGC